MFRLCLHCLLVFGLVFNGISAPWAKPHAHGGTAVAAGTVASTQDGPPHAMHAHHAHAPDAEADVHTHDDTAAAQHGDCGGSSCQCGCVVPPALAFRTAIQVRATTAADPAVCVFALRALHRSTAPFRPPADHA